MTVALRPFDSSPDFREAKSAFGGSVSATTDSLEYFRQTLAEAIRLYKSDELEKSHALFNGALPLFNKLQEALPEQEVFDFGYYFGLVNRKIGRPDLAVLWHMKGLRTLDSLATEDFRSKNLRKLLFGIAVDYRAFGLPDSALYFANQTLSCLPDSASLAYNYYYQRVSVLIGNVYSDAGDFEKSLLYQREGLRMMGINNEGPDNRSTTQANVGNCLLQLNRLDEAIAELTAVLKIRRDTLQLKAEDLVVDYFYLLTAVSKRDGWATCAPYLQELVRLVDDDTAGISMPLYIEYLRTVAEFQAHTGNTEQAGQTFEKGLDVMRNLQFHDIQAANLILYAIRFFYLQKQFDRCYDLCTEGSRYVSGQDGHVRSYSFLSGFKMYAALASLGQYEQSPNPIFLQLATEDCRRALDLLFEKNKPNRPATELEEDFYENDLPLVEKALGIFLQMRRITHDERWATEAFQTAERFKALELRANLKREDARRFAGIPPEILRQEKVLQHQLASARSRLYEAENAGAPDTERLRQLAFDLEKRLDALFALIQERHKNYFALVHADVTASVADLAAELAPDQNLLEFFVGENKIYTFVLDRERTLFVRETDINFDLKKLVGDCRQGLYGYHTTPKKTDRLQESSLLGYVSAASQLYDTLIRPIEKRLRRRVVVVPDGLLGYLPFSALLASRPQNPAYFAAYDYWLHHIYISYAYSANHLRDVRLKKREAEMRLAFAGFAPFPGNDVAGATDTEIARMPDKLQPRPLEFSDDEIRRGQQIFGGDIWLGGAATLQQFDSACGTARILHLSTHAEANDRAGDFSFLLFAGKQKLYVRDIYNRNIAADLVTLTACQTGLGPLRRNEGVISLARAFTYAGARSILTTLWSVNDVQTKDLSDRFYANYAQKQSPDVALGNAQRDFLRDNRGLTGHPFFWAGLISM